MLVTTVADTNTGLEVRLHALDEPGVVVARVSRTSRWVAEDLPEWTATVARVIADGVQEMFAQREHDRIRAMGRRGPVGSALDTPATSRRSRRTP